MTDSQYRPFYLRGQQDALASVAAWRELGWSSLEACRQQVANNWAWELAHAREQVTVATGSSQEVWKQHIAYFEGGISVLTV